MRGTGCKALSTMPTVGVWLLLFENYYYSWLLLCTGFKLCGYWPRLLHSNIWVHPTRWLCQDLPLVGDGYLYYRGRWGGLFWGCWGHRAVTDNSRPRAYTLKDLRPHQDQLISLKQREGFPWKSHFFPDFPLGCFCGHTCFLWIHIQMNFSRQITRYSSLVGENSFGMRSWFGYSKIKNSPEPPAGQPGIKPGQCIWELLSGLSGNVSQKTCFCL